MKDEEKAGEQLIRELNDLRRWTAELEASNKALGEEKAALLQERDMLRALIDNLSENLFVKDRDCRFIYTNKATAQWFGFDDPRLLYGKSDIDFFSEEHARQAYDDEQRIMETEEPLIDYEERETWEGAPDTWASTSKFPFHDSDGRVIGIMGISKKITEKKLMEQALQRRTQELARANEELQLFAYVASHDLQEPLRMISSYVQLLARRYKDKLDADGQEFIAFAVDGAARMRGLINDLLAYSRIDTQGKALEPTDCNDLVKEVLVDLQVAIRENEALVTHDELPTVAADRTQLRQLFQNLIGNAIKFRGDEQPAVHLGVEPHGEEWMFSVRDNGIGFDPKFADRIFAIFQRLHGREKYPGTGIGLAVCKKIVERHGGRIWAESQPNHGATFYFTLPTQSAAAQAGFTGGHEAGHQ
jgi:PAS domain S-box-containing protein